MRTTLLPLVLISMVFTTLVASAKDYTVDRSGNLNVNVIDRQVIVNDKVVGTVDEGEPITINGGSVGAKVDGENITANVGDVGAKIEGDSISINIGGILKKALNNINSEESDDEKNFFKGNDFFKD